MADHPPEENVEGDVTSCSMKAFKERYLKRCANAKVYLVLFSLTGIVQGTFVTYLIGISSTLERRFSYDTKITAYILLADNISPALFSVIVGYFGKYIHKPKFVSIGMMINVFSCALACCPYFLFRSNIKSTLAPSKRSMNLCFDSNEVEDCAEMLWETIVTVSLLFTANFFKGIASSAYYTAGTPYLDDNVKKKNSPTYLGVTFATRVFGPSLGFWLSSFCLKYYENPFVDPDFGPEDSRWIGAWWVGFLIIGFCIFVISFPIMFFPRYMQGHSTTLTSLEETYSIYDLFSSLKHLASNGILMFHTLGIIFQINGLFGYLAFMPRYIENQFRNSASSANFYTGTVTLFASAPVIFLSGLFISRFKPRPKFLTGYMLFVQAVAGFVMIAAFFLYCPSSEVVEGKSFLSHVEKECNSACSCNGTSFSPICDQNYISHFSPCSAGCQEALTIDHKMVFKNCSCITLDSSHLHEVEATKGICFGDCNMFWPYIVSIVICKLFASSAKIGNVLVTLRCVDEDAKSLTLGAAEFLISIFASIPFPLIYGYAIDQTCLIWEDTCQMRGNCLHYDSSLMRYYLHGISIVFIFLGTCCDCVVFMLSSRLKDFYEESKPKSEQNQNFLEANDVDTYL